MGETVGKRFPCGADPVGCEEGETGGGDVGIAVAEHAGTSDDPQVRARRHAEVDGEPIGGRAGHPPAHELLDGLQHPFDLVGHGRCRHVELLVSVVQLRATGETASCQRIDAARCSAGVA